MGDNEPYSGALENDCLYRHGTMNGLPHVLIEMRQDLVATPDAARAFALRLKPAIDRLWPRWAAEPGFRARRRCRERRSAMDDATRTELEAAVFRRLVAHLQERTDVQNIDHDDPGRFLPQLPGRLVPRSRGGKGDFAGKGRGARRSSTAWRPANGKSATRRRRRPSSRRPSPRPQAAKRWAKKTSSTKNSQLESQPGVARSSAAPLVSGLRTASPVPVEGFVAARPSMGSSHEQSPPSPRISFAPSSSASNVSKRKRPRSPPISAKSIRKPRAKASTPRSCVRSSASGNSTPPIIRNRKRCWIYT